MFQAPLGAVASSHGREPVDRRSPLSYIGAPSGAMEPHLHRRPPWGIPIPVFLSTPFLGRLRRVQRQPVQCRCGYGIHPGSGRTPSADHVRGRVCCVARAARHCARCGAGLGLRGAFQSPLAGLHEKKRRVGRVNRFPRARARGYWQASLWDAKA